ncbi:zinc ribbon domain-containing protein [Thermoplasma sp.]|uniref:zinc ribbon domain-containing protein n=1 Tax=Thermoplasma sp. TaxID=1973142 RepID=UPI0026396A12|nr:zinc ribbon domain-containing protein [Thermoplasma sp.]
MHGLPQWKTSKFFGYTAKEISVTVIVIDPYNSSRECPVCHTIGKRNRPELSRFRWVSCGFEGEADFVASLNIRDGAVVSQPIVTRVIFAHLIHPAASSELLARGS